MKQNIWKQYLQANKYAQQLSRLAIAHLTINKQAAKECYNKAKLARVKANRLFREWETL